MADSISYLESEDSRWTSLGFRLGALRCSFRQPPEEDWQHKLGFVTIPSLDSGNVYTIIRGLNVSLLRNKLTPTFRAGRNVGFRLSGSSFGASPGIEWWNWGDLDEDLQGKMLGSFGDPDLNGKDRKEEVHHLPTDFVLGYEDWRDSEDDEGNEMVYLKVKFDDTPFSVDIM